MKTYFNVYLIQVGCFRDNLAGVANVEWGGSSATDYGVLADWLIQKGSVCIKLIDGGKMTT